MFDFFDPTILQSYLDGYYLKGYLTTIKASVLALIGSCVMGVLIAIFRI